MRKEEINSSNNFSIIFSVIALDTTKDGGEGE
jgi:hypothetical protein